MPVKQIFLEGLPPFDIEVHSDGDQYISADILANGLWEPFETKVIRRCIGDNSDFYDVGANIGWYSVVAGLQLADCGGSVHAFEPSYENLQLLTLNVINARLSNVRINPFALGASVSPIDLYLSSTNKGDHRVYSCDTDRKIEKSSVTRFDHYFNSSSRIPFVKMDTQGFELAVAEGMGDHLFSAEGLMMLIEFWPHGLNQDTDNAAKLIHLLSRAGFQPFTVMEGDQFVRPTTWDSIGAAARSTLAPESGFFVNLLLCREPGFVEKNLPDLIDASPSHLVPHV